MALTAELLETLHRIHIQLADLRERQERGPRQLKAREASVAKLQVEQVAEQDAAKKNKIAADQKQLDLKSSEAKVENWKVKLNSCNSNKEFQTMQEQIAAAEMAASVLADEILEALERGDQMQQAVAAAKQRVEVAQADLSKFRDAVAEEGRLIAGDLKRLEADLVEQEKTIPRSFVDDYRRVIRGKGAEALARMEDGVCGGCGQQLTINRQNELLLSKPVFCQSCGVLLYAPPR